MPSFLVFFSRSMYSQMVNGHLAGGFEEEIAGLGNKLVDATIELHRLVMNNFLPRWGCSSVCERCHCGSGRRRQKLYLSAVPAGWSFCQHWHAYL